MRIGVPKETKTLEGRVALVPAACGDLVKAGHEVYVESSAGIKSGFSDSDFVAVGVTIAKDAAELYEKGELIVKVKEPIAGDLALLRKEHLLFCYLHLAPEPALTQRLLEIGLCGIAFESVEEADGSLPLLAPMSVIAGRIAVQWGTTLLHQPNGGKGKLLGGLPSADRGKVVVLGAGAAGGESPSRRAHACHNAIRDGRVAKSGEPRVISQRLQFIHLREDGTATDGGPAPYLDCRPITAEERELVADAIVAPWLSGRVEQQALGHAIAKLVPEHLGEVKRRRIAEIDKVEREVRARLTREINYWDARAARLRDQGPR